MRSKILFIVLASLFLTLSYSYSEDGKTILDEKIRYLKAPAEGEAFGLLQEKMIRFKFETSETYNDNIFLTKDNTKSDFITTISPGVSAYYGNSNSLYFASYEADMLIHTKETQESRLNQNAEGLVELFRNSRIKLTIKDSFRPTTDPATSETNEFIKRIYNDLKATIRYDLSDKTSWAFTYKQKLQNYISNSFQDFSYLEQAASPILYRHLSPKTSITGEYNFGIINYYEGTNYDSLYHQGRIGIEGRLTQKSTINLKAGYQFKNYETSSRKDTKGSVLEGIYTYRWKEKTRLEFIVAEGINESLYEDAGYVKSLNLYASLFHNLSNIFDLDVSGFYIRNDYPHETKASTGEIKKRSDNVYGFNTRLEYRLRHWVLSYVGYEFKVRESNMRDFDYKNNKISCGVKIDF